MTVNKSTKKTLRSMSKESYGSRLALFTSIFKSLSSAEFRNISTKHGQLSACMQEAIRTGLLKPGDKLPTEVELVELTPFSLGTVQRAIRSLVEAGLAQRKPWHGTFVTKWRKQIHEPWHFRFVDDDGVSNLPVYPRALSRQKTSQRGPWSSLLGQTSDNVIRVDRLVNVNDEFFAYSRFFLSALRFPHFLELPMKQLHGANFRVLLDKELGIPITRISHRVTLREVPIYAYKKIRVPQGEICMVVEIMAFPTKGECCYYQELIVPPSNRKLFLADLRSH